MPAHIVVVNPLVVTPGCIVGPGEQKGHNGQVFPPSHNEGVESAPKNGVSNRS